jgi:hypothetical protein
VLPALGAEQCLEFCGGLAAVLAAVGIEAAQDCTEALQEEPEAPIEAEDAADRCACR